MLRFKSRARTNVIPLSYILNCEGMEAGKLFDCPVAILTDSLTASSGEATLICFRGQERNSAIPPLHRTSRLLIRKKKRFSGFKLSSINKNLLQN